MTSPTSTRFHDLDALRAFAMIMGILFHAAWMFMPQFFYFPYPDAAATDWLSYFFYASHTYRMQLFYLVAGFFACMMIHKRGVQKFALNRLTRIGIPFVVFSIILVPMISYQYNMGALKSGKILSDENALGLTFDELANATPSTVLILHLWFLYYLLLLYGVTLIVRNLLRVFPPRMNVVERLLDGFEFICKSRWLLPLLAAVSTIPMMFSRHWFGIDSPVVGVVPHWQTVFEYWLFFAFGWALFHRKELLDALSTGYRWKLPLGVLLTIPLYFSWLAFNGQGYTTWGYPVAGYEQISDYPALVERITSPENEAQRRLRESLPKDQLEYLETSPVLSEHQKAGLADTLNLYVIFGESYFAEGTNLELPLTAQQLADLPADSCTPEQTMLLNRISLEATLPGILWGEERKQPYYWPLRLAFCIVYSLTMWLLVIGLLGAFRNLFAQPNATIRYWADASYWMYLIHINILFAIQYFLGDLNWHWLIKFPLYLVICFLIMLPTYHFLVRNTWLGVLLNGRRLGTSSPMESG